MRAYERTCLNKDNGSDPTMEASRKALDDDDDRKAQVIPSEKGLTNYAKSYLSAYMETVEKEQPDDLPIFAKNAPYDVEIALLPNGCFCMLFQKSNKEGMIVTDRDWHYVEGKVVSGIDHLITVYAHEGSASEDASAKGKKDAMNDIRAMESNEIGQASLHLEKIVDELTNVAMSNRASLKSIATQISKLSPIKDAAKKGFPQSDMLRMIQGLKDYPAAPVEITLDIPDRGLLEKLSKQLTESSKLIDRVSEQENIIEEIEDRITVAYDELEKKINEKIDKSIAVVLTSTDRKIDKGLAAIQEAATIKSGAGVPMEEFRELTSQIDELRMAVAQASMKTSAPPGLNEKLKDMSGQIDELRSAVAKAAAKSGGPPSFMTEKLQEALSADLQELKEKMGQMTMRIEVIEDYLMKISRVMKKTV